jgi:hypothetical protein
MATKRETLWEKTGIERDTVARRVLNTSETVANITAQELEQGVSLETLLSLNVPVYRYKTQITIHGKLPDISKAEYRYIMQNQNGSIGVRYVGIDYEKKELLCNVARLYKGKFRAHIDSQGMTAYAEYPSADELKAVFETIDPSIFYGTIHAFRYADMWSATWKYRIEISIDAIPQENVWSVASNLFDCSSEYDYQCRQKDIDEENARQAEEYRRAGEEYKRKEAEKQARILTTCQAFAHDVKKKPLSTLPLKAGSSFLYVYVRKDGVPALMKVFLKQAFGKLCYATSADLCLSTAPKGVKFQQVCLKIDYWQQKCSDGLVFAP